MFTSAQKLISLAPERIERFIEDQAFLRSYDSAPSMVAPYPLSPVALQRKSHLCIPRKGVARSPARSPVSVSDLYIPRIVHIFSCSRIGRLTVGI
jgi:hypothetical protein